MTTIGAVFKNIEDTLKTVEIALKDLRNELPERRHKEYHYLRQVGDVRNSEVKIACRWV